MSKNITGEHVAPFRYDFVGSFLRPASVKEARAQFAAGSIGVDELKANK